MQPSQTCYFRIALPILILFLHCGISEISFAQSYFVVGSSFTAPVPYSSKATGNFGTCDCPSNSVMVGYEADVDEEGTIVRYWIYSAPLNTDGTLGTPVRLNCRNGNILPLGNFHTSVVTGSPNAMVGAVQKLTSSNLSFMYGISRDVTSIQPQRLNEYGAQSMAVVGLSSNGANNAFFAPPGYVITGMTYSILDDGYAGPIGWRYRKLFGPPKITSISKSTGCANSSVLEIRGYNLNNTSAVNIGGVAVGSFIINSDQLITATIVSPCAGNVSAVTPRGTAISEAQCEFLSIPNISSSSSNPGCSGFPTNINATSSGNQIQWWTQNIGGSLLGTTNSGEDFSVSPTSTTTYYANAITPSGPTGNIFNASTHQYTVQEYGISGQDDAVTMGIRFTPAFDILVTGLRSYFGKRISIWTDSGTLLLSHSTNGTDGIWTSNGCTPTLLQAGQTYRIATTVYVNLETPTPLRYYDNINSPEIVSAGTIHSGVYGASLVPLTGDLPFPSANTPFKFFVDLEYGLPSCFSPIRTTVTVNVSTPQNWFLDADNDGYYVNGPVSSCVSPGTGYNTSAQFTGDCNDNDNSINTAQQYYVDADGDGFGSSTMAMLCSATAPAGYANNNTDCNDNDNSINTAQQYYVDADGDGFGSTTTALLCSATAPAGYANNNTDCNDNDNSINTAQQYYVDADGDGFGSTTTALLCSATAPAGYANNNTDCNDNDNSINTAQQFYVDADGDGFGSSTTALLCSATAPAGYANNNTDCNDNDNSVNAAQTYYVDADGDGFGSTTTALLCSATAPAGYANNNTDCNDNDNSINTAQQFYVDADGDGFGSTTTALLCSATAPAGYANNNNDCDDNNNAANPLATEICGNNIDDNCDGNIDENCGPATQLRSTDCGRLTFNLQSSIVADAVAGATQYEFQFRDANDVNVVATKLQTSRTLAIANVSPALQWGTNYSVRVRPIIGTAVGTYGAACTIGFLPDPNIFGIPATQLVTSNCGKLNYLLASSITADVVIGATQYEFEFRNVSTNALVATKIQTNNFTTLSSVTPALQWGTQYQVRVRAYYGSIAGNFGNTCLIGLIPDPAISGVPNTQLSNASCNKNGLSLTGYITCNLINGANQYEFEFTNPNGGALIATRVTTTATCALATVSPALQWGTTYNVRVRAFISGTSGNFSSACFIGIIPDPAINGVPSTRLNSMSCGNFNLTTQSSVVALTVSGASQYEFEFSNPSNSAVVATKITTSATCFLNAVSPALQWGTQYNVRVRAFIAGTPGTFGNSCLIGMVPDPSLFGVPATQIRVVDCGKLNFALNANTAAIAVAGATQYEFEFSDPNTNAVVATKLQASATLSLASVSPALQAGSTYNVRVRAYINSFQGAYGNVCMIGFASGSRYAESAEENTEPIESSARVDLYPNPFNSQATLFFSTALNEAAMMHVYDMSGRLVDQRMIQSNTNIALGENFERGVYIIQVNSNSGEQINTRLIKN